MPLASMGLCFCRTTPGMIEMSKPIDPNLLSTKQLEELARLLVAEKQRRWGVDPRPHPSGDSARGRASARMPGGVQAAGASHRPAAESRGSAATFAQRAGGYGDERGRPSEGRPLDIPIKDLHKKN
jgi:hypothetical protein